MAEGGQGVKEAGFDGQGMGAAIEEGEALAGGGQGVLELLIGGEGKGQEEVGFGIGGEECRGTLRLFDGVAGETFGEEGGGVLLFFHAPGGLGGAQDLGDFVEGALDGFEDGDGLFLEILEILNAAEDGAALGRVLFQQQGGLVLGSRGDIDDPQVGGRGGQIAGAEDEGERRGGGEVIFDPRRAGTFYFGFLIFAWGRRRRGLGVAGGGAYRILSCRGTHKSHPP